MLAVQMVLKFGLLDIFIFLPERNKNRPSFSFPDHHKPTIYCFLYPVFVLQIQHMLDSIMHGRKWVFCEFLTIVTEQFRCRQNYFLRFMDCSSGLNIAPTEWPQNRGCFLVVLILKHQNQFARFLLIITYFFRLVPKHTSKSGLFERYKQSNTFYFFMSPCRT